MAPEDPDGDGAIYLDPVTGVFNDAPTGVAGEETILLYQETNSFGTFTNEESLSSC